MQIFNMGRILLHRRFFFVPSIINHSTYLKSGEIITGGRMMSTIEIKNLTFGFDMQIMNLFEHANLILDTNWKLGLIGRNGRGKTTLLNLILGKYPYSGEICHTQSMIYFPQVIQDKYQLVYDALQNLVEFEQWELERELSLLHVDPNILWQRYDTLSGGEQTKLLLALLFINNAQYPLIDEPTNHLDQKSRKQVASYLKSKKNGFILISHDRAFVDEVVDHVLAIEKSKLILYNGNFSIYEEQKKRKDLYEEEQNKKLKSEISRIQTTANEVLSWAKQRENESKDSSSRRIAKKQAKRAKGILKRTEEKKDEKETLLKNIEYIEPLKMNYLPNKKHERLLKVENFQLSYEIPLFEPISFELKKGDRLILQGENGSGKSSIIYYLLNKFIGEMTGNISKTNNLAISYVRQNYDDNVGTLKEFSKQHNLLYEEFLSNLFKLGLERHVFQNKIENMSMGQKKRVELAKSLTTPSELFIWDEPLNYLDVFNQKQIEAVIKEIQPTMIIVEHDQTFIKNIATKVIELSR